MVPGPCLLDVQRRRLPERPLSVTVRVMPLALAVPADRN